MGYGLGMCGRFAQVFTEKDVSRIEEILLAAVGGLGGTDDLLLDSFNGSYNIAPTQEAVIGRAIDGDRRIDRARFGLVPSWAKDRSGLATMNNARIETVTEKPAYRGLVGTRRCVVPVSGFYEWETVAGARFKQPWYVTRVDEDPMMLAGLWDRWAGGGEVIDSFTLLTREASGFMASMHHRMPVVLEGDGALGWMGMEIGVGDLEVCEGVLGGKRVSRRVNSVGAGHDDAGLIDEVNEGEIEGEGTLWGG